ncbi:hypothetical protein P691DRAFT_763643 [Macrolepiota fuliginosa MF-IS2]|uniref:Uncharacterized protein n=1 Tax=Macrolepiota fuliginosa MF-IS2 TaxID=1400762 RepID=A0A9P5X525_9AGAR|nr:hypothetical protein P691DRAFT_763643 [Macrolepiota fuliginosa MF-IS2]
MTVSFDGASNFNITGGNFNEVAGNIVTYNMGSGLNAFQPGPLPLPLPLPGAHAPAVTAPPRSDRSARRRDRREARYQQSLQQVPLSPPTPSQIRTHASSNRPSSTRPTPAASTAHSSPASTDTALSDFDFEDGRNSRGSRYSTPPSDVEVQLDGPSGLPSQNPNNLDVLTPLTNSLGLRRFTPSTQSQTLSPAQAALETPQALTYELPPDRADQGTSAHPSQGSRWPTSPPPVPPRPASHASYQPPSANQTPHPGPPPPIPPRPLGTTTATSQLEDPSVQFARLQAQRDTKGYASGLNTVTYTPSTQPRSHTPHMDNINSPFSPPGAPFHHLPPVTSTAPSNGPLSPLGSAMNGANNTTAPQPSQHWTQNSISNWTHMLPGPDAESSSQGNSTTTQYAPSPSPILYPAAHHPPQIQPNANVYQQSAPQEYRRPFLHPAPAPMPARASVYPPYNSNPPPVWGPTPQHQQPYQNYGYGGYPNVHPHPHAPPPGFAGGFRF